MPFDLGGGYKPRKRKRRSAIPPGWPVGGPAITLGASPQFPIAGSDSADPIPQIADPSSYYQRILESDPLYQRTLEQLKAQGIADEDARNMAIRRALIQFGEVPDAGAWQQLGFDPSGIVDPQTQALAAQNTTAGLSTIARLRQGHLDAIKNIKDVLAARGMAQSGETGYNISREAQGYLQSGYDARQKLLDYASGVQAAFAEHQRAAKDARLAAIREASGRQSEYPWNQFPGGPSPPTVSPAAPAPPGLTPAPPRTSPSNPYGHPPPARRRRRTPAPPLGGRLV